MENSFDLERYLTAGVEKIVKGAIKASLSNPKESIFMAKYALTSKTASEKRRKAEEHGEHIPPFLIASITSNCNLHCEGCYSRANNACVDEVPVKQLTDKQWLKIFEEAKDLGVGFILLAGGEPMIRYDIIKAAGTVPEIIFPIFTNGTLINEQYIDLFKDKRNLIPVFSIEGEEQKTDERRGNGVYQSLMSAMDEMQKNKILYGASVTVTTANIKEVTSKGFLYSLSEKGCKLVVFVEFVPVTDEASELAPGDSEREYLKERLLELRQTYEDIVFISFPGDEKTSGGCLAAGRGFFHINSNGGAEPCPFSPYSDINVTDTSLKEALQSPLFRNIQSGNLLMEEHAGGCVLFEKKEQVEKLLKEKD